MDPEYSTSPGNFVYLRLRLTLGHPRISVQYYQVSTPRHSPHSAKAVGLHNVPSQVSELQVSPCGLLHLQEVSRTLLGDTTVQFCTSTLDTDPTSCFHYDPEK
jgi:hypothetical protein